MKSKSKLPSPDLLLLEARGAIGREAPLNVDAYASVIAELRDQKNYSFGKIAEWLGERVGREINKGIIYRVYTEWTEAQENAEEDYFEPEQISEQEEYSRAVNELAEEVLNFTMEKAKAFGSGGYIVNEAVESVLNRIKQTQADEAAAALEDAKKKDDTK